MLRSSKFLQKLQVWLSDIGPGILAQAFLVKQTNKETVSWEWLFKYKIMAPAETCVVELETVGAGQHLRGGSGSGSIQKQF